MQAKQENFQKIQKHSISNQQKAQQQQVQRIF